MSDDLEPESTRCDGGQSTSDSVQCGRCDGTGRVPQLGVGTEPCPDCDDAIPDDEYLDYMVVGGDLVERNERSVDTGTDQEDRNV